MRLTRAAMWRRATAELLCRCLRLSVTLILSFVEKRSDCPEQNGLLTSSILATDPGSKACPLWVPSQGFIIYDHMVSEVTYQP